MTTRKDRHDTKERDNSTFHTDTKVSPSQRLTDDDGEGRKLIRFFCEQKIMGVRRLCTIVSRENVAKNFSASKIIC